MTLKTILLATAFVGTSVLAAAAQTSSGTGGASDPAKISPATHCIDRATNQARLRTPTADADRHVGRGRRDQRLFGQRLRDHRCGRRQRHGRTVRWTEQRYGRQRRRRVGRGSAGLLSAAGVAAVAHRDILRPVQPTAGRRA
jgi:hypothetical protein